MHRFRSLKVFLICLIIISCGKSLPALEGIDQDLWKNDKNGCGQKRLAMAESISKEKDKLLALDELQIIKVLGKPDQNELFTRNQKFFYYFIEPSNDCAGQSGPTKRLSIRFNAMGLAKEITIE